MRKLLQLLFLSAILVIYSGCKQGGDTPVDPVVPVFTPTSILSKSIGSNLSELTTGIVQADDGGIVVCGYTISSAFGDNDIFVIKLDASGNVVWSNLYGGSGNDQAANIEKVDGGYVIAGTSNSFSGTFDPILMKLDGSGNIQWSKYYQWWNQDYAHHFIKTSDAGYIMTGYSNSFGSGENDIYSLKLDGSGGIMWVRCYGGAFNEFGNVIRQNGDGGYTIGGYTFSYGQFGEGIIIKLYGDGAYWWSKTYGGSGQDVIKDLQNASNGLVVCGSTVSFGLVTEDALVFNTDNNGFVYWARTFGGNAGGQDVFNNLTVNGDGSLITCGFMQNTVENSLDMTLVKVFGDGAFGWEKSFGGVGSDAAYTLYVKSDGGFLLGGTTASYGAGSNDIYVQSLKSDGTGCLTDNPVTPVGGQPTLEVGSPTVGYFDVNFYSTNTANMQSASFNGVQNTQCVQNP